MSLGRSFLGLYKRRRVGIEVNVEAEDIGPYVFVPLCSIYYDDAELEIVTDQSPTSALTDTLEKMSSELVKSVEQKNDQKDNPKNNAIRFVTGLVDEREKWVRDCVFASGLVEPTYCLLGFKGGSASPRKPLADFFPPTSYLHFFDTNVFMKHLVSNYFTLRGKKLESVVAAIAPGVIWELEGLSSRREIRESRLARSAFPDVSFIQGSNGYHALLPGIEDDSAQPNDRLIRRQIHRMNWTACPKVFMTFDRISSLAAHAESLLCMSLDVPMEKAAWTVVALESQPDESVLGLVLREFSIMFGMLRLRCEGVTDTYLRGDWPGKTSHEWIEGLTRWEPMPI
jgi:hypothetical protein